MKYLGPQKITFLLSSCIAGAVACCLSLPFDNVKTKLQKMKANQDGTYPYKGIFDCFYKSISK